MQLCILGEQTQEHTHLTYIDVPGHPIFVAYRGSKAHGTYVPSTNPKHIDDIDVMGVVVGDPQHYYGLHEWGSRGTKELKQDRYDCVFYEARKIVSLLLQGNPNVLSLLWTQPFHWLYCNDSGQRLVDNRRLFVGKHVYNAFVGYAHAQLEKMESRSPAELRLYLAVTAELKARGSHPNEKGIVTPLEARTTGEARDVADWTHERLLHELRHYQRKGENLGYLGDKRKQLVLEHGYDTKNAAHLIRLLRMCIEFLRTGELVVWRPDAFELLAIKLGKWSLPTIKELAQQLFADAKTAYEASELPETPDAVGAQNLLMSIVQHELSLQRA